MDVVVLKQAERELKEAIYGSTNYGPVETTYEEFRLMKEKATRYKSVAEFGKAMGLSSIEIELVRQKKQFIQKLTATRLKKKISQAKLAEMIGSKQPAIARMESGLVSEVSLDFLAKIALALEVTLTIKQAA